MKAIVVGNNPDILESNLGKKIDSFDVVIRLGAFKLRGYEAHVGSRVDVCMCRWRKFFAIDSQTKRQIQSLWFPYPKPPSSSCNIEISSEEHFNNLNHYNISDVDYMPQELYFNTIERLQCKSLTLGLAAILLALAKHDSVSIIGIGTSLDDQRLRGKYWNPSEAQWNVQHNLVSECIYIQRLINNNNVRRLK